MKCIKGLKSCKPVIIMRGQGPALICAGVNKRPTRYKKDNVWLCLRGVYLRKPKRIEMTRGEALMIASALLAAAAEGVE